MQYIVTYRSLLLIIRIYKGNCKFLEKCKCDICIIKNLQLYEFSNSVNSFHTFLKDKYPCFLLNNSEVVFTIRQRYRSGERF